MATKNKRVVDYSKMKINVGRFTNKQCDLCGITTSAFFAFFTIPGNAEISLKDSKIGFFQICEGCVHYMWNGINIKLQKDAEEEKELSRRKTG